MLPNGSDVRDVYFGPRGKVNIVVCLTFHSGIFPNGSLEGGNSLFVDSSTIGPQIAQEVLDVSDLNSYLSFQLSRRLEGLGQRHVDAPVTGGVIGAEKGTLTFMCGGLEEDVAVNIKLVSPDLSFQRLQDIFAVIGRHVFHCGGAGAGQIVKVRDALKSSVNLLVKSALALQQFGFGCNDDGS